MSRSNKPSNLDPAALNNMPEEDKQWDQVASFPPPRPPPATGPLFNDWLDGDDHAHSLGHTAPQFGCLTE
ncbi:hypothetical protein LENED_010700 [Lentinula edodes]|uniref:Uncharacterized protein n=1 Tax=Lentinula edodes TaxID=5353 RepID=A0A1Q3EN48_LENED|nr:hypothetical protein LENED_010700 [Lentinula edodes]